MINNFDPFIITTTQIEGTNYEIIKKYIDYEEDITVCYLRNYITGDIMIPSVHDIVYEPYNQVFKVHDIVEINENLSINIYFYYTWSGKVLGLVYNDYCDFMTGIEVTNHNLVDAYQDYKVMIKEYINNIIDKRMEKHKENNNKFLHLVKRDDKSESKI